jgi:hypothetical protein
MRQNKAKFLLSIMSLQIHMAFCSNCGSTLSLGTEKFCPSCGQDLSKGGRREEENRTGINITGTHGDVIGTGVSGTGNIIGKNIVVGSGTISVSEQQLARLPDKYAQSLKTFSDTINEQLKGQQVQEDKVKEVNETLNDFAKEAEDIKPGEEQNISPGKKRVLNGKFGNVVRGVLKALPTAARIGSSLFAPLAPFSNAIGESVEKVVADYIE